MYMFSGSEHSIDLIREGSRRSFKPVLSHEYVFQMRGIGWGWRSWFWPYRTLYFASSFGRTLHRLELLGPYFKTRDLPFLSNTTLKATLRATLVGTFFDLLQENWVQNGGVFRPSLHGVQRMPFRGSLQWKQPWQNYCPRFSYLFGLCPWHG